MVFVCLSVFASYERTLFLNHFFFFEFVSVHVYISTSLEKFSSNLNYLNICDLLMQKQLET